MNEFTSLKTYTNFGLMRSLRQMVHAFRSKKETEQRVDTLLNLLRRDEERIVHKLGRPLEGLRVLEVGPGQGMERVFYFGMNNDVTVIDLDVIPKGFDLMNYLRMLRENSIGRMVKTFGRKILLVDRTNQMALKKALGANELIYPTIIHADICGTIPEIGLFDLVVSWSVFEHLVCPSKALDNIIRLLRPDGAFYICICLYTCNVGHHDIRAFTGLSDKLPLWGHLRSSTRHLIHPSAYLNTWRLSQWRGLFSEKAPNFEEFLETHGGEHHYRRLMTSDLRSELCEYTDEELFTVDALYMWMKQK